MAEKLEQKKARLDALVEDSKWLNKVMYIYFVGCTACFTMEMMMVHGILDMFALIAKDLYPDDKDKQLDLIQRHLVFYNTQFGFYRCTAFSLASVKLFIPCCKYFFVCFF